MNLTYELISSLPSLSSIHLQQLKHIFAESFSKVPLHSFSDELINYDILLPGKTYIIDDLFKLKSTFLIICKDREKNLIVGFSFFNDVKEVHDCHTTDDQEQYSYPKDQLDIFELISYAEPVVLDEYFPNLSINNVIHLDFLGVSPNYSGQSIGTKLVEYGIKIAKERGFNNIITSAANIRTYSLLKKVSMDCKIAKCIDYKTFQTKDGRFPFESIPQKYPEELGLNICLAKI